MLKYNQLYPYQYRAIEFQCLREHSMLFLDMGLGKSVITLTSIQHLIKTDYLTAVLVVAPIRVCNLVWKQEAAKWEHTQGLKFANLTGNRDQRTRTLKSKADVYLINYENLEWLSTVIASHFIKNKLPIPFNGVVFDEITKCKNSTTKRVKAYLKIQKHFKWATGLTGTPASNGLKDLHGQYLVIDGGERLGRFKTKFQTAYFKEAFYKLIPYPDTSEKIQAQISDITLEMGAADYNPLPKVIFNDIWVELPPNLRKLYNKMEKEFFLNIEGQDIRMFNTAALMNKCFQFSNGAVYVEPNNPEYKTVHDLKLAVLEDILEEASGNPILCSYGFKSDAARIMEKFKKIKPINLSDCKNAKTLERTVNRWKKGDLPLMIGHPASIGHGLDGLQDSCHQVVWFGLNWSLDLYSQLNARVLRQGQTKTVIVHRILTLDTFDIIQKKALDDKATTENELRIAIKNYGKSKNYIK